MIFEWQVTEEIAWLSVLIFRMLLIFCRHAPEERLPGSLIFPYAGATGGIAWLLIFCM
jgi:hypothetical protein